MSAGVAAASAGITALGGASIVAGSQFETSLAQLSTIADTDAVSISQFSDELKALSSQTGQSASDLALVAYNAISAGTDTKDAMQMVKTATDLATGGFTSTDAALSVLTTTINAYGDAAGSVESISDSLIMVQNLGVTTVDQLSSSMGKAIATGSAYGISLGNLESSYVSLTKQGISTEEATTYMASMFNELGDSGSEVGKILKEKTGQSFGELMQNGYTLADAIGVINDSVDGNAEAMMNLWGSAEAGKASNAIINEGLDTFNENLNTIQNSTGATSDAVEAMSQTFEYKAGQIKQSATNLGISVYEGIQEGLSGNGGALDLAMGWLEELQSAFEEGGAEGLINALGQVLAEVITNAAQLAPQMVELAFQLITALGNALVENGPQILQAVQELVDVVMEKIGEMVPELQPVTDAIQELADNFQDIVPYVEAAAIALGAFKTALAIGDMISTVSEGIGKLKNAYAAAKDKEEGLTVAQWLLNEAMEANVIFIIISVIAALVAAFIYLWNTSDSFRQFWIDLWENVKETASNVIDAIVGFFTETIPNAISGVIEFVQSNWKSLLMMLNPVTFLAGIFSLIYNNCDTFRNFVDEFVQNVKNAFVNAWNSVVAFFTQTLPTLPAKFMYWLGYLLTSIALWGVDLVNWAAVNIPIFVENIITAISQMPGKFVSFLKQVINSVTGWGSSMVSKAKETGTNFLNGLIKFIKTLPQKVAMWLKNTIERVAAFVVDMKNKAAEAGKEFFNNIVDALKGLPEKLWEIGKNAVEGIISGIKNKAAELRSEVKKLWNSATEGANDAVSSHGQASASSGGKGSRITGVAGYSQTSVSMPKGVGMNAGTVRMNYEGASASGSYSYGAGVDYRKMKQAFAESLQETNLVVQLNNREMGRVVRGYN